VEKVIERHETSLVVEKTDGDAAEIAEETAQECPSARSANLRLTRGAAEGAPAEAMTPQVHWTWGFFCGPARRRSRMSEIEIKHDLANGEATAPAARKALE